MKNNILKSEIELHRYHIREAVKQVIEDDHTMAYEWIFKSYKFDSYCRKAGICPKSVREVTKRLLAERDAKLEKFEYERSI